MYETTTVVWFTLWINVVFSSLYCVYAKRPSTTKPYSGGMHPRMTSSERLHGEYKRATYERLLCDSKHMRSARNTSRACAVALVLSLTRASGVRCVRPPHTQPDRHFNGINHNQTLKTTLLEVLWVTLEVGRCNAFLNASAEVCRVCSSERVTAFNPCNSLA